jgi:hypothetical protein
MSTRVRHLVGLDGEMSGSDPQRHRLIQIGVAAVSSDAVSHRIGWPGCPFEPQALSAIGWTVAELAEGPPATAVDRTLVEWAVASGFGRESIVPIGWGVSTFDLPFVRRYLPEFSEYLSHHAVELNAVCYAIADVVPLDGVRPSFEEWRRAAKDAAEKRLAAAGVPARWHDAGYDAQAALACWEWLRETLAPPEWRAGNGR